MLSVTHTSSVRIGLDRGRNDDSETAPLSSGLNMFWLGISKIPAKTL